MYFRHLEDNATPDSVPRPSDLTRREFLTLTTVAGTGLTLGLVLPGCTPKSQSPAAAAADRLVMPFVRIAPDNTVTVICKHLEAGQGVWTGLPAIVAEELDASWDQMRVESAPAQVPLYGNLAFGGSCARRGLRRVPCWWRRRQSSGTFRPRRSP